MVVCTRCQEPLVATARFCGACGSPVRLNSASRSAGRPDALAETVPVAAVQGPATAPLPAVSAVAAARPNPVSPMASSVMSTPGGPAFPRDAAGAPYPSPAAAPNPYVPGAMVLVHWANGQRYPGTVLQSVASQVLVAFPNGQQHWVDVKFVLRST